MRETSCPHCGKSLEALLEVAFCPYCGGAVTAYQGTSDQEPENVRTLIEKVQAETDPRKKHDLLLAGEAEYPQSLAIAEELLFLGRLYERGSKNVDFSIIKCYLFMLYLAPEELTKQRQNEFREELFHHPLLEKCLSLCSDKDAFLRAYLLRLEREFITLFLRGDSRYMRRIMGFAFDNRASKLLARPVANMIATMHDDDQLLPEEKDMLVLTLYQAFSKDMGGDTQWLDEKLEAMGLN